VHRNPFMSSGGLQGRGLSTGHSPCSQQHTVGLDTCLFHIVLTKQKSVNVCVVFMTDCTVESKCVQENAGIKTKERALN